jgi:hypothetical protein
MSDIPAGFRPIEPASVRIVPAGCSAGRAR